MLQRIQTIYLFFAALAFALALWFPIAKYAAPKMTTHQTVTSELRIFPKLVASNGLDMDNERYEAPTQRGFIKTWPLAVLIIAAAAIAAISIALFNNRVLQMRVVAVGFLLGVIYIFLVFIWAVDAYGKAYAAAHDAGDPVVTWTIGTWAPLAGVVLMFLAQRAIRKDEAKVRAADRLR